jgi:hypothetical protein
MQKRKWPKKLGDGAELQALISEITRYDVFDFIARVSSLNLLIENQNKNILFDALIQSLMLRPRSTYTSAVRMSSGKFRNIISRLDNLELKQMADPAENAFIERVRYYGNYWIFPGTNYSPGYCLQGFLDALCLRNLDLDPEFTKKAHQLIYFILFISNAAAKTLDYDLSIVRNVGAHSIHVPDAVQAKKLQYCTRFDYSLIENLIEDQPLRDSLFFEFKKGSTAPVLDENWQDFFAQPFLIANDGTVIILNPSILVPFLVHKIVSLAGEYGIKAQLVNAYNNELWNTCRKDLRKLGHKKIDERAYGISLINDPYRKEEICTVGNDKLLFVHFVCDAGDDYDIDAMYEEYKPKNSHHRVHQRAKYFMEHLPQIQKGSVYQIVIINSFGRLVRCELSRGELDYSLTLSPAELHYISINERNRENFIPRYIDAKKHLKLMHPPMMSSELNYIEVYTQHDHSFYLSDDFNPKTTYADLGFEWTLDYVIRATQKEDRHLIDSYDGQHLAEIVLSDPARSIYIVEGHGKKTLEMVVKFTRANIWFTTDDITCIEQVNIVATLIDAISYWLAECKDIVDKMQYSAETIRIHLSLSSPIEEYSGFLENNESFSKFIRYEHCGNMIRMIWSSAAYLLFGGNSSNIEKEMVRSILLELEKLTDAPMDLMGLDDIFTNPLKRKIYAVNVNNTPYVVPTSGTLQQISPEEENRLLDEIGEHFLTLPEYDYGKVPDDKRAELANKVVGYLYSLLQAEVATIKPDGMYKRVCLDLETVMYRSMISQRRYAYDIACYPEKRQQIIEDNNETTKSSVALKFLAEYIAATPPNGGRILGAMQYDRILAICRLIIDWAYRNDLFRYSIINSPIQFLPSGRIGMPREEGEYLAKINAVARTKRLESLSDPSISVYSPSHLINQYQAELDDAFSDEYGFSFQQFMQCILSLAEFGEEITGDVKRAPRVTVIQELSKRENIQPDIVDKVLDQITLGPRADYLVAPAPFVKNDVYPWRFNRELSFTRRPIIQHKDDLIWGNRQLHHMWRYTIDLMIEGKYKARKSKLKKLIGKLGDKRGNDFNSVVVRKLTSFDGLIVREKLSKVNGKKIASPDGNVLGDIDVFYIIPEKFLLVVGEVKDFSIAKNPYEMNQEYQRIFVDSEKPCYMTKHKRRATWIEEHTEDVKIHFNLPAGKWTVKTVMFVSEEIVSNAFYHQGETIIVYSDITEDRVKQL